MEKIFEYVQKNLEEVSKKQETTFWINFVLILVEVTSNLRGNFKKIDENLR